MRPARRPYAGWLAVGLILASGCAPDPELRPDEVLRYELGLSSRDEVHTVMVTGGEVELADPAVTDVPTGAYVQFITGDFLVHEIIFEADSLGSAAFEFMTRNDQMLSPPLIHRESRFVVSFVEAPLGRYPFRLEGNGRSAHGAVVVSDPDHPKR